MDRYLAVIPLSGSLREGAVPPGSIEHESDLALAYSGLELFLAASSDLPVAPVGGDGGYVIGTIHLRDGNPAASRQTVVARLAGSRFETADLLGKFWGNYVAFLRRPGGPIDFILRAPFGSLPCVYACHEGRLLIASDLAMLRLGGLPAASIDENALVQHLAYRDLQSPDTSISGVRSIPGGRRLRLQGSQSDNEEAWSPWQVAGRQRWLEARGEAERHIRSSIMASVRSNRADAAKPLLLLSGGLDSSILAACLSSLGGGYASINLLRRDSIADERQFARKVTAHLGSQLIEAEWDIGHIDLCRADSASPNPNGRILMQSTNRLISDVASEIGADLTIDGGGGDNVFLGIASAAPVADALLHSDGMGETWEAARSIAALAQVGMPEVLRRAALRVMRRSRLYPRRRYVDLLSPEAAAAVPLLSGHPWLHAPSRSEAGTAAHIALIAAAQSWAEARDLQTSLRHASPLIAQPVIEACLTAPSWWWFRDGANRIVARDAFADRLPPEIVMRRSKGAPDSFAGDIYLAYRSRMREILLDGHLRRRGLIDVNAIDALQNKAGPFSDPSCGRILYLTQVEAWIAAQAQAVIPA